MKVQDLVLLSLIGGASTITLYLMVKDPKIRKIVYEFLESTKDEKKILEKSRKNENAQ